MNKKLRKTFSFFRQFHLNWELQILAILNTILGITSECVNKSPLRFHVTLGETFFKSTSLRMMKKHDKSALMEILQVFGPLSHVDCQSVFQNLSFYRVVSRSFLQSLFRRYMSYDHHLFFKMFKILSRFQNRRKKWENVFKLWDNCIWIESCKFSQSSTAYSWHFHILTVKACSETMLSTE